MNNFVQRIPGGCDISGDPLSFEFNTTEELLALEYVQRFAKHRPSTFVMEDNCLMVISDNGYHWWVVGYIEKPNEINLPKWDGPKYR